MIGEAPSAGLSPAEAVVCVRSARRVSGVGACARAGLPVRPNVHTMRFVAALGALLLCVHVHCHQGNICKVPNGASGVCVELAECWPLQDLYERKHKTELEQTHIRQSYCGNPATNRIKVCCPSKSTWFNFVPSPVIYHNTLFEGWDDTPVEQMPTTSSPKTSAPAKTPPNTSEAATVTVTTVTPPTPEPVAVTLPNVLPLGRPVPPVVDGAGAIDQRNDGADTDNDIIGKNVACGKHNSNGNRITGGEPTAIDQYPWLVLLEYAGGLLNCGGSLITSQFVLSAAHCIESLSGKPKLARLGEYNITTFPTDVVEVDGGGFEVFNVTVVAVRDSWPHPDFNREQFTNDIGLILLAERVVFDYLKDIICLPNIDYIPQFTEETNLTVAGWGDEAKQTEFFDVKKEVSVPYVTLERCASIYERKLLDSQICAGGEEGKDTCKGDSGGPIMHQDNKSVYVVGVVSYGPRDCGTKGRPAIYTNVFKYLKWIRSVVRQGGIV